MEIINWSLNAIDTIFSTRRQGSEEPRCPDGTFAAGYAVDPWGKWRTVCLSPLSIEDVEDVYLFGFMIICALLTGLGVALVFREIREVGSVINRPQKLPGLIDGLGRVLDSRTANLSRNMDSILENITALRLRMDNLESNLGLRARSALKLAVEAKKMENKFLQK